MDTAKELSAGAIAGMVQVLVGQPFDTVKVRLQTQSIYKGPIDCAKKTFEIDGLKGFYKGTLTPLVGTGVCVAVQFGAMEGAKRYFGGGQLTIPQLYMSGAFAGLANSVISGPMEHVRIRLQVQQGVGEYKGPGDFISKVYRQYGVGGLFKGQGITLLREGHGFGVYFAVYEYFIQRVVFIN
jgi:solute carrier family 25 carnitine/acylcarnitine transporter 20/29